MIYQLLVQYFYSAGQRHNHHLERRIKHQYGLSWLINLNGVSKASETPFAVKGNEKPLLIVKSEKQYAFTMKGACMNRIYPLLIVVCLALGINCSSRIYTSHWQSADLVIDGQASDWPDSALVLQERNHLQYLSGWINSDTSLHMLLSLNDMRMVRLLNRRGFTLWVSDSHKKRKHLGFRYVNKQIQHSAFPGEYPSERREPGGWNKEQMQANGSFSLVIGKEIIPLQADSLTGFQAESGLAQGLYCFEFAIPLDSSIFRVPENRVVQIGFEIERMPDEDVQRIKAVIAERRQRMSDGFSGSPGAMPGAGMAPGPRRMPNMDGMETWVRIKLASD